jgi:hypothetical protein
LVATAQAQPSFTHFKGFAEAFAIHGRLCCTCTSSNSSTCHVTWADHPPGSLALAIALVGMDLRVAGLPGPSNHHVFCSSLFPSSPPTDDPGSLSSDAAVTLLDHCLVHLIATLLLRAEEGLQPCSR